jgi:ABC-type multidrug transport system permease subunit
MEPLSLTPISMVINDFFPRNLYNSHCLLLHLKITLTSISPVLKIVLIARVLKSILPPKSTKHSLFPFSNIQKIAASGAIVFSLSLSAVLIFSRLFKVRKFLSIKIIMLSVLSLGRSSSPCLDMEV